jgi:hypothetical protein
MNAILPVKLVRRGSAMRLSWAFVNFAPHFRVTTISFILKVTTIEHSLNLLIFVMGIIRIEALI